jgi:copper(I)-binding protein
MFTTLSRAALAAVLAVLALPVLAEGIEVHDAYLIQAMPGGPTAAAFMVIHNHGGPPDRLVDVRSDIAARTELHTHSADADGVMRMGRVEGGFDLPTDGEILMQRGADHVMFMGVEEPLAEGQVIPLTLVFETAGEIVVDVVVGAGQMGEDAMGHGDMDHGDMDHGGMDHGAIDHGHMDHGGGSD